MAKRKKPAKPAPSKRKESLRSIYAGIRREFSAADLQNFTEIESTVMFRQVLPELEAIHEAESRKRKKA